MRLKDVARERFPRLDPGQLAENLYPGLYLGVQTLFTSTIKAFDKSYGQCGYSDFESAARGMAILCCRSTGRCLGNCKELFEQFAFTSTLVFSFTSFAKQVTFSTPENRRPSKTILRREL